MNNLTGAGSTVPPTDSHGEAPQGKGQLLLAPAIGLPKGGGAIRGIGEKFAANPVTGTGSMTVPIATSPGRNGFGPQLSLGYDSGAGNGPFGFGWGLSLPAITRKTDKGLPHYRDWSADPTDADAFVLSGAEDMVPVFCQGPDDSWVTAADGQPLIHEDEIDGYRVRRFRPRLEGLFARIERWQWIPTPADPRPHAEQLADVHWRSISNDNILTIYGADTSSRIADPEQPQRIFSWLICETRDDKGNGIRYVYKQEDGQYKAESGKTDPLLQAHQRNRGDANDPRRTANRYIHRILYGNRIPLLDDQGHRPRRLRDLPAPPTDTADDWLFEVRFDYGELHETDPTGQPEAAWGYRPDAFSSYRSGFEVRTCRRCERVLMLHHISDRPSDGHRPAAEGYAGVVGSTEFVYDDELDPSLATRPVYSFLKRVVHWGWKQENGTTIRRSLPPLDLRYSKPAIVPQVHELDPANLENLPAGLDGAGYRWVDLHGEGLPGILSEQAGQWLYRRNLSPVSQLLLLDRQAHVATFAPLETVASQPNAHLAAGAQILDLAGDGQPDVVSFTGPLPGLYEHDGAEGWEPFRAFRSLPGVDFADPNLRFIDLDGDGHTDLLVSEGDAFVWHPSLAEDGFGAAERVPLPWDEEQGPRVVFADGTETIHLADLSGDGLSDLVRIRNGEVCYWPNLGYGRFGAKVTMDHAPRFDHPGLFNPKRLLLADIDGSGTTDLIYLHREGVRLYFNQAGNGWSAAAKLPVFPPIHDATQVTALDLLGNGTACLVWSSPLPGDVGRQMRYVKLMGDEKPNLLIASDNNLGAETRIRYASSLRFYLEDKLAGNPWITRLPFPVQVVERVETIDHIGRNRFVSRYAYHHGYFDGEEREFRGFGMVEQWDSERIDALAGAPSEAENEAGYLNESAAHSMPPVHTKTWFHTGAYLGRDRIARLFEWEYYREPGLGDAEFRALLLPDTPLPDDLTLEEEREACRALKGTMLRQEVYADDDGPDSSEAEKRRAATPYSVAEQNVTVRRLQERGPLRHAVFFTQAREAITYHYERNPADPRIQHTLTLEVDDYGNVLKSAAVGYGRRERLREIDGSGQPVFVANPGLAALPAESDRAQQTRTLITAGELRVTNLIDTADDYRTPLPCEQRSYELTGFESTGNAIGLTALGMLRRFTADDLVQPDPADPARLVFRHEATLAYEVSPTPGRQRRLLQAQRTHYRPDDLGATAGDALALLPLGELQPLALPGESYALALTPGLLHQTYRRDGVDLLPDPATVLAGGGSERGGYRDLDGDGHWWTPSGRAFFSADRNASPEQERAEALAHFFLPRRMRGPFDTEAAPTESRVSYDALDLLMVETVDALGNRVTVGERDENGVITRGGNDYRVLQPWLVSDPNRNRTAVAFDALGMVVGTAVMGKPAPALEEGDSLDGFVADLTEADRLTFFAASDPHSQAEALVQKASTRILLDLDTFARSRDNHPDDPEQWQPARVVTVARETHANDPQPPWGARFQIAFAYSDGLGREIQRRIQAEPGRLDPGDPTSPVVDPRWVGSGWTVFNNKGLPVRQYEPFFRATHHFEFAAIHGVSPVLFYDPAGRTIATLHPNHSFEKLVFDPWQQTTYDVNDTCAARPAQPGDPLPPQTGDPRTDPDIQGYVRQYFNALPTDPSKPWQTWHAQRIGGALGVHEQQAAERAAAHADTPATTHIDALGRPFLTVARNRVACAGHDLDGSESEDTTRVELDIQGRQRAVRDAIRQAGDPLGRIAIRYSYDLLGSHIHQLSMEAGPRWMLGDVAGNPIRAWDGRGHSFRSNYDRLRRPLEQWVQGHNAGGEAASDPRTLHRELLIERIAYGEGIANAEDLNLRGRSYRLWDGAGVVTNARLDALDRPILAYDFKGNLRASTRRLVRDYRAIPDWSANPVLEDERFEGSTRYDALNRPIQSIVPHSSLTRPEHPNKINVLQPVFNEAGLLERVDVWLERATEPAALLDQDQVPPSPVGVANIDHNARGQRLRIDYKNGASTFYRYDQETFRLIHLYTRRGGAFTEDCENPAPPPPTTGAPDDPQEAGANCGLQNLHYTYDPAGNITHIQDDAQQKIFFRNRCVQPSNDYVYDALYRLIQADGREHLGQGGAPIPHSHDDAGRLGLLHPGDCKAMGRYIERYVYDAVGNFLQMQHRGSDPAHPGWTRAYDYLEPSLIEDGSGGTPLKTSNRLSQTMLNPAGNTPQPETYLHDAHGNMTRMPHLGLGSAAPNMHWDARDRLRRVDLGGGGAAFYVYDASGERVRKVWEKSPGLIEERIYLGGFEIFRRHDGPIGADTAVLERETLHVMDGQQRLASVETRTLDKAGNDLSAQRLIRYQIGNHLGSSSLELDDRAAIISYEEYAPYGSTTYQAVRSQTETAKRYRYTGKERDEESGLDYYGFRYFAPWISRWTSCDPIESKNRYVFTESKPLVMRDLDGREPRCAADPRCSLDDEGNDLFTIHTQVEELYGNNWYDNEEARQYATWLEDQQRETNYKNSLTRWERFELRLAKWKDEASGYIESVEKSFFETKVGEFVGEIDDTIDKADDSLKDTAGNLGSAAAENYLGGIGRIQQRKGAMTYANAADIGRGVSEGGYEAVKIAAQVAITFGPGFKKYWNVQEIKAAEYVWKFEGLLWRREAVIYLEKNGKLIKTKRRLDALLFDVKTGKVQAVEWTTPKQLTSGARKRKQLQYQEELFQKADEDWTIWARPEGEKAYYEITHAVQRTEVYPHRKKGP